MLRNIPACISPEMLHNMMRMGHGDELVRPDGDFPVETYSTKVVYAYGLYGEILKMYYVIASDSEIGRRQVEDLGKLFNGLMAVDDVCKDLDKFTKEQLGGE